MAITTIRNTRLGRVLPGSTPRRLVTQTDEEEITFNPTEGSNISTTSTDTGSLSGAGTLLNAQTNRLKFDAEQAAARAALERQQAGALAQARYLQAQLGAGVPTTITGEIEAQQAAGEKYIADQAAALLGELQKREQQARGLTTTGFSNLQNYLARTQPAAYSQAPRAQAATMSSDLMQYLAGQGVSGAPVQSQVDLANLAAQGGATNYNQLLDVLTAREAAAQQSRQAEAEMGLTSQLANLQAIYGQGTSQLEQQRLAALADLSSRISAARLQAQTQQTARDQAIQDALAALVGTGVLPPGTVPGTEPPATQQPVTAPAKPTPVEQLAAKTANIKNQSLVNRIENFVASNPNATPAQIKKQFPSLGANITR